LIEKYETTSRLDYQNKFFDKDRRLKDQADTRTRNDDAMRALNSLPMGEYYSYDQIVEWMQKLQHLNPSFVRQISIGTTHEGRNIVGLIVRIVSIHSILRCKCFKKKGTIYPCQCANCSIVDNGNNCYCYLQLISRYGQDPKITEYVNTLNIYIFPCLNPDGYEYTRSDPHKPAVRSFIFVRMWRKNRSPEKCVDKDSKTVCCKGVDLNRNFAFRFAEIGSSSSPCSEIYHGNYAFSEPESRAIRDAVLSLGNRIDAYITLHTYSQLWIYPYSHKKHAYSEDVNDLKSLARKAVASLQQLYGTHYRYGTGPEIIYPYAGGSCDWAKETAKIKYTYTLELRPSSFDWNGFILDKRQLIPTGRETFEGVKVVLDKVIENEKRRNGKAILIESVDRGEGVQGQSFPPSPLESRRSVGKEGGKEERREKGSKFRVLTLHPHVRIGYQLIHRYVTQTR
ncbi:unnamed protein product, partial [Anisakis simplex]|uniref:Peptidase_M14 domain-containing protein n=1 Tax=Anisakis simplex TaxID=6269 RepID=A0A0M3JSW7_ANISI